jgi:4-amino-4-deoxy-L-arabinose transferase-like glycosyltransferase
VGESENGHTHYFSPLWPIVEAGFYALLGPSGFTVAVLAACLGALLAAWFLTRDLWGDAVAVATVGFVGYGLAYNIPQRGAEPLAMVFYLVMLWSIVTSIRPGRQKWVLLAGVAAGLAYLTRASIGLFFVLGGLAGLAWRLYFHQRRAFNRWYIAAILAFGACYGLWMVRNLALFWDGTLGDLPRAAAADAVFQHKFSLALTQPLKALAVLPLKLGWALYLLWPVWLLRHQALLFQLRNLRDETQSGLFLSWMLPLLIGSLAGVVSYLGDTDPPPVLFNPDNLRYVLFAIPALLWNPWDAGRDAGDRDGQDERDDPATPASAS